MGKKVCTGVAGVTGFHHLNCQNFSSLAAYSCFLISALGLLQSVTKRQLKECMEWQKHSDFVLTVLSCKRNAVLTVSFLFKQPLLNMSERAPYQKQHPVSFESFQL